MDVGTAFVSFLIFVCLTCLQQDLVMEIGVSKLCCPVCRELLSVLDKSADGHLRGPFNVRGFHSVATIAELPSWLPDSVLQEMLWRLSIILVMLLDEVIRKQVEAERVAESGSYGLPQTYRKSHYRNPSTYSATSDVSSQLSSETSDSGNTSNAERFLLEIQQTLDDDS